MLLKKLYWCFIIILLVCIFAICKSYSQTGVTIPTLIEPPDARHSGMGNTGTAVANDIYATYWNPAGLGFLRHSDLLKSIAPDDSEEHIPPYFEAAFTYTNLPLYSNSPNSKINAVAGMFIEPLSGTMAFDYTHTGFGDIYKTDINGNITGKYKSDEYYFGLAYGTSISENLGIGAKIKFYTSNLYPVTYPSQGEIGVTKGLAFDVGVLWYPDLGIGTNSIFGNKCFSLGLNLQNLGPSINYHMESEPLPTTLRLGTALKLNYLSKHKLTISIDAVKNLIKRDSLGYDLLPKSLFSSWNGPLNFSLGFGAEYWFMHYFAFRAGYYTEPGNMGNRQYLTFGGSIRLYIVQADISYYNSSALTKYLTNVLKITLRIGG